MANKINLTEMVKSITLEEAIAISNNVEEEFKQDSFRVLAALLKLQSFDSLIAAPLKTITDKLTKIYKKNGDNVEASTQLKIKEEGQLVQKELVVTINSFDTIKTDIDFDSYKEDNGIAIIMDGQDAILRELQSKVNSDIKGYILGKDFGLLKVPTIAGNPTAFEAAAVVNPGLNKYKNTKTVSKYAANVALNTVVEEN